jgi:hypothetical protein
MSQALSGDSEDSTSDPEDTINDALERRMA